MVSAERLAARIISNREKILRYAWTLQLFGGVAFLALGYMMGHQHFYLILHGLRAPGTIVAYKQENFWRSSDPFTTTRYMPFVEFHANDRFVQFQDWLGSNSAGARNVPVMVLYDASNPTIAMIDRPAWNWLPWAPVAALPFRFRCLRL